MHAQHKNEKQIMHVRWNVNMEQTSVAYLGMKMPILVTAWHFAEWHFAKTIFCPNYTCPKNEFRSDTLLRDFFIELLLFSFSTVRIPVYYSCISNVLAKFL